MIEELQLIVDGVREVIDLLVVHIWCLGGRERIAGLAGEERLAFGEVLSHGHEFSEDAAD